MIAYKVMTRMKDGTFSGYVVNKEDALSYQERKSAVLYEKGFRTIPRAHAGPLMAIHNLNHWLVKANDCCNNIYIAKACVRVSRRKYIHYVGDSRCRLGANSCDILCDAITLLEEPRKVSEL